MEIFYVFCGSSRGDDDDDDDDGVWLLVYFYAISNQSFFSKVFVAVSLETVYDEGDDEIGLW